MFTRYRPLSLLHDFNIDVMSSLQSIMTLTFCYFLKKSLCEHHALYIYIFFVSLRVKVKVVKPQYVLTQHM